MIERALFFELLHKARGLKHFQDFLRLAFLGGYRLALREHLDEIKAGQNIADVWKHQRSGAE